MCRDVTCCHWGGWVLLVVVAAVVCVCVEVVVDVGVSVVLLNGLPKYIGLRNLSWGVSGFARLPVGFVSVAGLLDGLGFPWF